MRQPPFTLISEVVHHGLGNRGDRVCRHRSCSPALEPSNPVRVSARRHIQARKAHERQGTRTHFLGPVRDRAHEKDGSQDRRARHPPAGCHHEGQRQRDGQRGRVFPRHRPSQGGRGDRRLLLRDEPARADHVAQCHRTVRVGRNSGRTRADQPGGPRHHRPGDRSVGHRGHGRGGQRHRSTPGDEASDGQAGRGGTRKAGQGHRRRRRGASGHQAGRSCPLDPGLPCGHSVAIPPDGRGDRR